MRNALLCFVCTGLLLLVACGGGETTAGSTTSAAPAAAAPEEVITITSVEQFDAEIAKARPGAVVVADFHAEWCGPCKKLGPELNALATINPGKLYVLKVDIDQQPKLAERFQVESIPLLVKFVDGKAGERQLGFQNKDKLKAWLAIK
jgi:thioredoxin